jgi:hypothetical protein
MSNQEEFKFVDRKHHLSRIGTLHRGLRIQTRVRIKVKLPQLERLIMESWRALSNHNEGMEAYK